MTVELSGFLGRASEYMLIVLLLPLLLQLVLKPKLIHGVVPFVLRSLSVPLSEETLIFAGILASPVEIAVIGLEILECLGVD